MKNRFSKREFSWECISGMTPAEIEIGVDQLSLEHELSRNCTQIKASLETFGP